MTGFLLLLTGLMNIGRYAPECLFSPQLVLLASLITCIASDTSSVIRVSQKPTSVALVS